MNSILQSFEELGLNLDTGVSPIIPLSDVVERVGKPLTGNGSVVRRDNKPWSFFSMENIKDGGRVVAYKFNGYMTVEEEVDKLLDQIAKTKERARAEEAKNRKRIDILQQLHSEGNNFLYSKEDII